MYIRRIVLWVVLFLPITALSQAQKIEASQISAQDSTTDRLPDAPSAAKLFLAGFIDERTSTQTEPKPDERRSDNGLAGLVKRGVQDQANIYMAPFHKDALKWDLGVAAVTTGLIVTEPDSSEKVSDISPKPSRTASDIGLYGTMGTIGAFYVSGLFTDNAHAKETGFLGAEAIANATITYNVLKIATGRERPLIATQNGRFWHYNRLGSSFPSGHSALTWAGATVIAHEYPKRWVQILAYGTATGVAFTRYSSRQHFPSDVFLGSVIGYFIGRHIFHAHCQEGLSNACDSQ